MSFENKISNNIDESELITNKICIQELIKDLDNREKQIIMLRYYKNNTQTQVSRILGISQVQVSRIEKKILETMKKKIS
jgi:RNA polymerase sporulation-specific sigma factor